jgi:hypothetical protein
VSASRYANVGQGVWVAPNGRQVPYLLRRLLPAAGTLPTASIYTVGLGQRIDNIAAAQLGDATLSWLLADANLAVRPTDLAVPSATIMIPQPGGGTSIA